MSSATLVILLSTCTSHLLLQQGEQPLLYFTLLYFTKGQPGQRDRSSVRTHCEQNSLITVTRSAESYVSEREQTPQASCT